MEGEEGGSWLHLVTKGINALLTRHGQPPMVEDFLPMTWLVILVLAVMFWRATRRMELVPGGLQNFAELVVDGLRTFAANITGPRAAGFGPFVATLFIFIFMMNVLGLIPGFVSPTSNLNTTVALALTAFVAVQYAGIRAHGLFGYVKHLIGEPWWMFLIMMPVHIIGELAKPLSLAIRLFGNIFGEDMVIVVLAGFGVPLLMKYYLPIPVQFPLMAFGLFTSFVQSLIFAALTAGYIAVMTAGGHEKH